MPTYTNPGIGKSTRSSEDAGQVTLNPFFFDLAAAKGYRPATIVAADKLKIGEIPAGEVFLPHLSTISVPILDSGAAGDYSIGTEASAAVIKASAPAETAVVLSGEDFLNTATIGNRFEPTPIYITALTAAFTIPATGVVTSLIASRPWDSAIDGQGT